MREDFDNRKSPPGDVRRMEGAISANSVSTVGIISLMIAALLGGLPVAVWLDLNSLAETNLLRQAGDLNSLVSSVRGYYAANVVGRVLASPGVATQVAPNYKTIPGAIPIPATLSLELGRVISEQQQNIAYRFISDFPFKNRTAHALDAFETRALAPLRGNASQQPVEASWSLFTDRVRHISPIVMGTTCVSCHNSHPDSPKTDWKVGDVRGIQEITVAQPIAANIWSFQYLLIYLGFAAASGLAFITLQWRQAATIQGMNRELEA